MAADRAYGWVKDHPSNKDRLYAAHRLHQERPQSLPSSVDLRPLLPPCYDQGQLGSCTANAIAGALEYLQAYQKLAERFTPSRLFIYYGERQMEFTVSVDSGAQIRDGIKFVAHMGAPPETEWPYEVSQFTRCPPLRAWRHAREHQAVEYFRVDWHSLHEVKACLAAGFPIVFGFNVYESFESDPAGWHQFVMPMPSKDDASLGGHAVLAVGYDDAKDAVLVRNSWGPSWGEFGHFWMPYSYITGPDSDDFWTVRQVEDGQ